MLDDWSLAEEYPLSGWLTSIFRCPVAQTTTDDGRRRQQFLARV